MILFFYRTGLLIVVSAGWLVYQLALKKKSVRVLSNDALFIAFFMAVWGLVVYLFS
jgi:hypothetical protein